MTILIENVSKRFGSFGAVDAVNLDSRLPQLLRHQGTHGTKGDCEDKIEHPGS